jgi:hypothetical protein
MSIVVPFNFAPESVDVKTASYTIPTGKYAYVAAHVENGGTFTIDSTTALSSEAGVDGDVDDVSLSGLANGTFYTVPSGYRFEGIAKVASGNLVVGGVVRTSGTEFVEIKAGSGATIATTVNVLYDIIGYSIRVSDAETSVAQGFWLPAGTVINGTGTWRATVSIYNEIS